MPPSHITNKLAAIDARFAMSSRDLAQAIRRIGSTADDARVSVDQLIACIAATKQATSRNGVVIGNVLKTVFSRIRRANVLAVAGVSGYTRKGRPRATLAVLKDVAKVYGRASPTKRQRIAEAVGGVFMIFLVTALLRDLTNPHGIYCQAYAAMRHTS